MVTRIRPTVRGFGPVAPGGGAAVGAALQGAGEALGAFGALQTNRELLNIREQEEVDRLEFKQFEKMERSEAIAQFTAKQIVRNEQASRIVTEAREGRDFSNVQQDMDRWESDFNETLFEGRSQQFREIFEGIDRSARVGSINKLGTAVEAGTLRIIADNYQISIDNLVESVNEFSDPAEINEQFDSMDEVGVNMGFTQASIEATSGQGRREAMERHVRSLLVVDGLAALSDPDVASALGNDGRETLRRDLITRANSLESAQRLTNEVNFRTTGIDVLDAFRQGEDAISLNNRIRNAGLSPTREKDMLDSVEILSIARERGPQPVDPEIRNANKENAVGLMNRTVAEFKAVRDDETKEPEEKQKELSKLIDEAIAIYGQAELQEVQGAFVPAELVKLRFKMNVITEGFFVADEVTKKGINILDVFIFGPFAARAISRERQRGRASELDLRISNAIVADEIDRMNIGEGKFGGLSSEDKASMEIFLIEQSIAMEDSGKPLPREQAVTISDSVFSEAEDRLMGEVKRLSGEAAEQVKGLIFNSGSPATEPRQQPRISVLADGIRRNLDNNLTIEQIEANARGQAGFNQEAFNGAVAAVDRFIAEAPALPARIVTPAPRDIVEVSPELTEEDIIESILEANPALLEEESVARAAIKGALNDIRKRGVSIGGSAIGLIERLAVGRTTTQDNK